MLLYIAVNFLFLGLDTYLVHSANKTIVPNEWIPIIFSPIAAGLLLLAGIIALRRRNLANMIATITLIVAVLIGLLGMYFHLMRGILPDAPAGQQVSIYLLVCGPRRY